MKSRLLSLAVAAVLVVSACGDTSQVVATVNGSDITANFMASLRNSYGRTLNVNTEAFREDLSANIILIAIRQRAEADFGIVVSEGEITDRITNPPALWQEYFAALAADQDATDVLVESQAELSILRDKVAGELIRSEDGFIAGTLRDSPQLMTVGCVRHILVDTEAEADAAIARLAAGEDFIALAQELTTDTVTGGDYVGGCPAPFAGLAEPFALAATTGPLNEVIGPVETQFGFHVMVVEQRNGPPTLAAIEDDPVLYYPGTTISEFFTPWFNEAVRGSEISVAPSVGEWSAAGIGIVPPGE